MSRRKIELVGKVFGRLEVIGELPIKRGQKFWIVKCLCGTVKEINGALLRKNKVFSCGCYQKEINGTWQTTHGKKGTPTYSSWRSMITRCTNSKSDSFKSYGGRGISMCDRWKSFESFLEDMGERPIGTTLDRIDGTKGYEPGNCKWSSPQEQANNRSTTMWIEWNGETLTLSQWSQKLGIPKGTVSKRIKRGLPLEEVFKQ